jgi:hypothetical protein
MNSDSSKVRKDLKSDKTVNVDIKLGRGGLNLGYVKSKTTNIRYVTSCCEENKAGPSAKSEKPKSTKNKKKSK